MKQLGKHEPTFEELAAQAPMGFRLRMGLPNGDLVYSCGRCKALVYHEDTTAHRRHHGIVEWTGEFNQSIGG